MASPVTWKATPFLPRNNVDGAGWRTEICFTAAEQSGYELFLTADKNLRVQQNLAGRRISIVVLGQSPWPLVRQHIPAIIAAVTAATPGSFLEVDIPLPLKKPFTRS